VVLARCNLDTGNEPNNLTWEPRVVGPATRVPKANLAVVVQSPALTCAIGLNHARMTVASGNLSDRGDACAVGEGGRLDDGVELPIDDAQLTLLTASPTPRSLVCQHGAVVATSST
jgi:hypothetical protein